MARTIGAYRIEEEIARGAMGVVYRAYDEGLDRRVALKLITTPLDPEALHRFRLEGQAAARVHHPNVLAVHALGVHEGRPYLVMDLAQGSLRDRLRRERALSSEDARATLLPIADAVAALHEQQVLHRDLKPENVLFGEDGRPLLADFGIAKAIDRETRYTETGILLGSPAYMAPEQARGSREVGPATDVYGLGAVLYELLTGAPPFRGSTVLETLDQVLRAAPVPPSDLVPGLDRELERVCLRCLAKDPAERFPSARALVEALQGGPASAPDSIQRWLVGLTLASLGVALASLGVAAGRVAQRELPSPVVSAAPPVDHRVALRFELVGEPEPEGYARFRVVLDPPPSRSRLVELRCEGREVRVEVPIAGTAELRVRLEASGRQQWTAVVVGATREPVTLAFKGPALPTWYLRLEERPPLLPGLPPQKREGDFLNEKDGSLMRWIPPGTALMANGGTFGKTRVTRGFYLGKYEVYAEQMRAYLEWASGQRLKPTQGDLPAENIDFHTATRYCRWAGGRLPRISEWNLAAYGRPPHRLFPWGESAPDPRVHDVATERSRPAAVTRSTDETPETKIVGLGGGVSEWVADRNPVDVTVLGDDASAPSTPSAVGEHLTTHYGRLRELRGASYVSAIETLHARFLPPRGAVTIPSAKGTGVRLARSPHLREPPHLEWSVRVRPYATPTRFRKRGPELGDFLGRAWGRRNVRVLYDPWVSIRDAPRDGFGTFATTSASFPPGRWVISVLRADDGVRVRVMDGGRLIASAESWKWQVLYDLECVFELKQERELTLEVDHYEIDGGEALAVEVARE